MGRRRLQLAQIRGSALASAISVGLPKITIRDRATVHSIYGSANMLTQRTVALSFTLSSKRLVIVKLPCFTQEAREVVAFFQTGV